MKKKIILTVVCVALVATFAFGTDLSHFVNFAAEPKPGG